MTPKIFSILSIAFALYCNFMFYKFICRTIIPILKLITPNWFDEMRKRRAENQRLEELAKREVDLAQIRMEHYQYRQDQFVNIRFIEEDRSRLFKGHDIKWQYGRKSIDPDTYTREASHQLAFMMFQEMAVYRWEFQKTEFLWTNEMELFFRKILPAKYQHSAKGKRDYFEAMKQKALKDFDSDDFKKAS